MLFLFHTTMSQKRFNGYADRNKVCLCVCTDLLPSVDDVLCIRQSVDAGPPNNRVMAGRGVGHFHRTELKERLTQRHPAEQHLPGIQTQMDGVNRKVKSLFY